MEVDLPLDVRKFLEDLTCLNTDDIANMYELTITKNGIYDDYLKQQFSSLPEWAEAFCTQ